jgi:hypothetical protein
MRDAVAYVGDDAVTRLGVIYPIGFKADLANGGLDHLLEARCVSLGEAHRDKDLPPELEAPEALQESLRMNVAGPSFNAML